MTSWSAVAGQLTMPGSSINDTSGLVLGSSPNSKQTGITLGCSSALVAQLGRAPNNLEYCSVPCPGFNSWLRPKYVKEILSTEHKKHSNRVMGYRVCQLILCHNTTY